jgi:bacteriocin-like protein
MAGSYPLSSQGIPWTFNSLHYPNRFAMGKSKKRLDDLKKDLKELKKEEMKNIVGGRDKKNRWKRWLNICGNILPQ